MMKPYRIKHVPTGLYYKPANGGDNLSKTGKVYFSWNSGLGKNDNGLFCHVLKGSRIMRKYGEQLSKYKTFENYKLVSYFLPSSELIKELL